MTDRKIQILVSILFFSTWSTTAFAGDEYCQLHFSFSKPPPSRTICTLTKTDSSHETQVNFDVELNPSPARKVSVATGVYALRCYSRPLLRTVQMHSDKGSATSQIDLSWRFKIESNFKLNDDECSNSTSPPIEIKARKLKLKDDKIEVANEVEAPSLKVTASALPEMMTAVDTLRSQEILLEKRGLDSVVPNFVVDTLHILAEIAIERAEQRAFAFIKNRIVSGLCDATVNKATFRSYLPRTCSALDGLTISTLIESSRVLAKAVQLDIVEYVFDNANLGDNNQQIKILQNIARPLVVDAIHGTLQPAAWYGAILDLAAKLSADGAKDGAKDCAKIGLGLQLALAVVATCQDSGQCDNATLTRMVQNPSRYFADADEAAFKHWDNLPKVAATVRDIVRPPPGTTTENTIRRGAEILLETAAALSNSAAPSNSPETGTLKKRLRLGSAILRAAMERDVHAMVTSALSLATSDCKSNQACKPLKRFAPVVAALTANAENLQRAEANPKDAEALRAARKQTIEALIDANTSRASREDSWVISLGANVGFHANARVDDGLDEPEAALGLPMGIAMQHLPTSSAENCSCWFRAWHFQISFVDLGQFLSSDGSSSDIRWNDFALIGGQIGKILFLDPENLLTLGADVRFIPGGRNESETYFGGFISYYVPFFDFN